MRVLIQRVNWATVIVNQEVHSKINKGLLLFVCFEKHDDQSVLEQAVKKIINLRIFEDEAGKMNQNILQVKYQILSVSQFTLSWRGTKGNRPSFENSLHPSSAKLLYHQFNHKLQEMKVDTKAGIFAADMKVELQNDGPVTFMLDF
jgi:D-tyrosyl-tRNA(Tyr) deacylase